MRCVVSQVFPLSEVAAAHQQVESGHTRGKVVLSVPQVHKQQYGAQPMMPGVVSAAVTAVQLR